MKYERSLPSSFDRKKFTESFLPEAKARTEYWIKHEKTRITEGQNAWPTYGTPISRFDDDAAPVLGKTFTEFLSEKREQKDRVTVMDVMGTGGFMDEYLVDNEVAVTLVDHRDAVKKEKDTLRRKKIITGDILAEETWEAIRAQDSFDLVTCRPMKGWETIKGFRLATNPYSLYAELTVVENIVSTLDPNGGTLIVEMSGATPYDEWTKELQQVPGIDASYSRETTNRPKRRFLGDGASVVRITRTNETYGELPLLPQNSEQ